MLGAGVFGVFGPVAAITGSLLPAAILLAGFVAYLNAGSISQLAAKVPRSGGAYAYASHYLNPTWGFLAGSSFLVGKIGSAAAIALTVSYHVVPGREVPVALGAVAVMTIINIAGINRTALGAKVLASITVIFLLVLVGAALLLPTASEPLSQGSVSSVPAGAAIVFFAFAGYARVATLGGELVNPRRAVPRAIAIALAVVLVIYLVLGLVLPAKLGSALAGSPTALGDLAAVAIPGFSASAVSVIVALACLGSLLALLTGMSRTAAVMAADGELPRVLNFQFKNKVPIVAELGVAALVALLVLSGSFLLTLGLSSFAVLTYYAVANLAAYRQPKTETRRPKWLNLVGLASCLLLALSVPVSGLLLGLAVISAMLFIRWALARRP